MYQAFLLNPLKAVGLMAISMTLITCTQMTRHSNTLVFGTDTTIGIKVGQDANQIPSIELGYNRQEAAFVPLLANTSTDTNGNLKPCSEEVQTDTNGTKFSLSDCHFRATHNGSDKDSYSTIASFGSQNGASTINGGQVNVAVAQYFATGIAAQHLVLTGGANIVQAGGDTKAKADAARDAARAISEAQEAAVAQYSNGASVALQIMGNDRNSIIAPTSVPFQALELRMNEGGSGCDTTAVDRLLQRNSESTISSGSLTVGTYIDRIRQSRPSCFDTFIIN